MTLAQNIYTILFAGWDIAVIAKPTKFTANKIDADTVEMRECAIHSREEGTFEPSASDGSDDIRNQNFFILGAESTEADCGKCIAQIKKILKRSSTLTNGTYLILTYRITNEQQICKYYLTGNLKKLIDDDAF